jgi:hypothetical protein
MFDGIEEVIPIGIDPLPVASYYIDISTTVQYSATIGSIIGKA